MKKTLLSLLSVSALALCAEEKPLENKGDNFTGFYIGAQAGGSYSFIEVEGIEKKVKQFFPNVSAIVGYRFKLGENVRLGLESEGIATFTPMLHLGYTAGDNLFYIGGGYNVWGHALSKVIDGIGDKPAIETEFPSFLQATIGYERALTKNSHLRLAFSYMYTKFKHQIKAPKDLKFLPEDFINFLEKTRGKEITVHTPILSIGYSYNF